MAGSTFGGEPHSQLRRPPYFFGMQSSSMYLERVDLTSFDGRMKILETVMGSNLIDW